VTLPARRRAGLFVATLAAATLAVPAGVAAAASVVSSNWAGYVAHTRSGRGFTSVSASWTEPAATCQAGRDTHSAVWVGLGGYAENAKALEQIGTDADCAASGDAVYSSWVELLPAAATTLHLKVAPGDRLSASVTVIGHHATLRLRDLTTGKRYSTTRHVSSVDVSTADWIVEAPSGCTTSGQCETLALTNFGSVAFTNATATAAGHTGTVADARWTTTELTLNQALAQPGSFRERSVATLVSAIPSSDDGGSFSVAYGEAAGQPQQASETPTLPSFAVNGQSP
jgi:hypothetical protein